MQEDTIVSATKTDLQFELECLEKGYLIKGDSIYFNASEACLIKDFRQGKCHPSNQPSKAATGVWWMIGLCLMLALLFLVVRRKALKTQKKRRWK